MIERNGGEHLAGDNKRKQRRRAERGQQQDRQQDEGAAEHAAGPRVPRHIDDVFHDGTRSPSAITATIMVRGRRHS